MQYLQGIWDSGTLGWHTVRNRLWGSHGRLDTCRSQTLQRSPTIGTLETWSPEVGTSGLALPPWQAAHQESQATHPALLVSVQSSPFLQNHSLISLPIPQPELSLPSSLIPHTFTGTVGHESLPSVKVIFSCFKKSTYSSYYSEDEKKFASFFGLEGGWIFQYIHANEIFHLMDFIPVLSMHILNKLRWNKSILLYYPVPSPWNNAHICIS